jgi:type II secretory pathway pseudopilin PulG
MQRGERCGEHRPSQTGFTLVAVLVVLALASLGLAVVGPRWSDAQKREKEADIIRVGTEYAQAIGRYYERSPGAVKQYPPTLEHLLRDERFVGTLRHLRRPWPDPLRPERPWGLVRDEQGHVMGVFVNSAEAPVRTASFSIPGLRPLAAAQRYDEWQFVPEVSR